jgi:hypothetical protein
MNSNIMLWFLCTRNEASFAPAIVSYSYAYAIFCDFHICKSKRPLACPISCFSHNTLSRGGDRRAPNGSPPQQVTVATHMRANGQVKYMIN